MSSHSLLSSRSPACAFAGTGSAPLPCACPAHFACLRFHRSAEAALALTGKPNSARPNPSGFPAYVDLRMADSRMRRNTEPSK